MMIDQQKKVLKETTTNAYKFSCYLLTVNPRHKYLSLAFDLSFSHLTLQWRYCKDTLHVRMKAEVNVYLAQMVVDNFMYSDYFCVFKGFKPFVEACIEEGDTAEALKYIVKLTDPQERAEVCMHFCDECKLKIGKYVAINALIQEILCK